ncbi:14-3-3 domain-containing protein [Mycena leptocephala]|nr:14-3-3 domain-containing protein [Mycena leptocephala]
MERRLRLDQAILASSCGRYRDTGTLEILRPVACSDQELTLDERTLFASACGNLVKRLRYSCKATSLVESHPGLPGDRTVITTAYRQRVQGELFANCTDVIQILQDHLMKSTQSRESLVFFRKMIGDFYRYLAEFSIEVERRDYTDQALESYMMASHLAANHPEMPLTHPTRLVLVISFSVFYHDILQNHDAALEHSCQAFNDGVKHLDWLTEETCTESILLLQILKDNSTIWSLTKNVNTQPQAARTQSSSAPLPPPIPTTIKPTTFLSLSRGNNSIEGTYVIDPCIKIPQPQNGITKHVIQNVISRHVTTPYQFLIFIIGYSEYRTWSGNGSCVIGH